MNRAISVFLVAVVLSGCSPALRRTRVLTARDDLDAAAFAAGDDRLALREVSLAVLARGLEDRATRSGAARGLAAAGPSAAATLARVVSSADPEVATVAAAVLFRQGRRGERLETLLRAGLTASDPEVRAAATRALGPLEPEEGFFRARLADEAPTVRLAVVEVLARRPAGDLACVELLTDIVRTDPSPAVRARALRALGRARCNEERLVDLARAAMSSPSLSLRLAAVDALAPIAQSPGPRDLLLRTMRGGQGAETVSAALALAVAGEPEAVPHLVATLSEGAIPLASATALGSAPVGEPLLPALVSALDRSDPEVRLDAAASLLGTTERDRALVTLRQLLEQPGWIGLQAALVLAREDERAALPRLGQALEEDEPRLRAYAAAAAGLVPASLPLLTRRLADDEAAVRVAAAAAVLRLLHREG